MNRENSLPEQTHQQLTNPPKITLMMDDDQVSLSAMSPQKLSQNHSPICTTLDIHVNAFCQSHKVLLAYSLPIVVRNLVCRMMSLCVEYTIANPSCILCTTSLAGIHNTTQAFISLIVYHPNHFNNSILRSISHQLFRWWSQQQWNSKCHRKPQPNKIKCKKKREKIYGVIPKRFQWVDLSIGVQRNVK